MAFFYCELTERECSTLLLLLLLFVNVFNSKLTSIIKILKVFIVVNLKLHLDVYTSNIRFFLVFYICRYKYIYSKFNPYSNLTHIKLGLKMLRFCSEIYVFYLLSWNRFKSSLIDSWLKVSHEIHWFIFILNLHKFKLTLILLLTF